jgi:hypothetical protein
LVRHVTACTSRGPAQACPILESLEKSQRVGNGGLPPPSPKPSRKKRIPS